MSKPEQNSHFWFMSIQIPDDGAGTIGSYQGTATPAQGATRMDMFESIWDEIGEQYPAARRGSIVAFDIQPNKL